MKSKRLLSAFVAPALLAAFVTLSMIAPPARADTILSQNFSTDPPENYTLPGASSPFRYYAGPRYWAKSDMPGLTVNAAMTGSDGPYLGAQNLNDGGFTFTEAAPAQIDFTVSVAEYSDLKLSIALAGMPTAETANFIRAKTDNDGDGAYETTIFNFLGNNNSAYTDTTLGALTSAFQTFSNLVLPTPTAPDGMLRLRFETFNDTDSANEATGFDSILISGTPLSLAVSITSPSANQAFLLGASISATATVASGTPPYTVNFYTNYNGGAYGPAGTASTSPYTVDLGILAEGTYTIYSTVTDSASPTPGTDTSVTNTFTVDGTQPTLAPTGIVDNQSGGPVQEDTTLVTYTVTFSEDMDASTVSADDFGNAGDTTFTIGTVTETAPGVFSVPVTPTSVGTLQLQVNASAELKDLAGNALDTTLAIVDDTPITVTADTTAPTPDPLTWATAPKASGASSIVMTATNATDGSGVEYFFECTAGDGHSSGWQNSATYTDTGLLPNATYTYRVQARDKSTAQNATGFSATASATTLLWVTGSHGGDQYAPNGLNSLLNGSGMTRPDLADPSTWTVNYGNYPDEWMGDFLVGALNSKLAWVAFDLGASAALHQLYLWNIRYGGGVAGTATYNLYYANSPAVALPAKPNAGAYSVTGLTPQGDYDFSSGGWTQFNTSGALSVLKSGNSIVDLSGISARYIALEILTNWGDTYQGGRVGFLETAFTPTISVTPTITTFGISGTDFSITFDSVSGLCYMLQYTDLLPVPLGLWTDVSPVAFQATGPSMTLKDIDVTGTNPQRFYRVVQVSGPCSPP